MTIRLSSLNLFCEVAKLASFSEVARRHDLPPSSVSRQIDKLETSLKTLLFQRTTRSLTLTDAGHRYLERIAPSLADIEAAHRELADETVEPTGLLRVSSPTEFTRMQLAPRLNRFLASYPRITVDLSIDDLFVDLVQMEIDVAIRFGHLRDSSLVARRIAIDRAIICASSGYLEMHGIPEFPDDLGKHNCLIFHPPGENASIRSPEAFWQFAQEDEEFEVLVKGNMLANSVAPLITAVLNDSGIIMAPQWSVDELISDGRLQRLLGNFQVGWSRKERAIQAVYQSKKYVPSKVRAFIDFLVQDFRNKPY